MRALSEDRFITPCLEVYGEYSREEWLVLEQLAKPGMTVVEAGANIGSLTVPLARRCAPGILYAFEPQKFVLGLLCDNLRLNGITNVKPILAGCGAEEGTAVVPNVDYAHSGNFGAVSLVDQGEGDLVKIMPIDGLNLAACGLIKIDVEGAELATLDGASKTIRQHRPVLYVENAFPNEQGAVIEKIASMDYDLYWHCPPLVDAMNFNNVQKNIFGQRFISINMICAPSERRMDVRDMEKIDPRNWRPPTRR
jgi:FkbM family methyltransferase